MAKKFQDGARLFETDSEILQVLSFYNFRIKSVKYTIEKETLYF